MVYLLTNHSQRYIQMFLDVSTIAIMILLGALLAGFGISGLAKRFGDTINGIQHFSNGLILFIFGWGFTGLEGKLPHIFPLVIGPLLLLSAVAVIYQDIRRFQGQAYSNIFIFSVVGLVAVLMLVYTFVFPSAKMRMLVGSGASVVLLSYSAIALLRKPLHQLGVGNKIMAGGFIWLVLVNIISAGYAIIVGIDAELFFVTASQSGIAMAGYIIGMLAAIFGFVMMIYDKHQIHLEKLSTHDELTRVFNRRTILEFLRVASANSRRDKTSLSVLMIDLDDFKQVNDKHGHMEGDLVLTMVAKTLASVMRENDSLGRYGGEEFIAVLPNTNLDGASILAERVRAKMAAKAFD